MTHDGFNSGSASVALQSDLIKGCRQGDIRAQLQVYKIYYKSVYNLCLKRTGDPGAAEDMMHESFLSAFENINDYSDRSSFAGWIISFINKN